jgi:DNA-binding PadR family transcriptional regulator
MSVRHALLALLSEGPKYGLQLREEFEARTGEVWPLNVGQVYTTLQRLERDGLVESDATEQDSPQKGFRITASGVGELARWLRTPPDLASPPRDELVIKVLVALRLPGTDVRDVIQVHRRYLVELMQQWTRIKETEADSDLNLALVVDAELFRLDAAVRWLDTADGRIKRAATDAPEATETTKATQEQAANATGKPEETQGAQASGAPATAGPVPPSLPKRRRRAGAGR